jgi:hypothetical protein
MPARDVQDAGAVDRRRHQVPDTVGDQPVPSPTQLAYQSATVS